MRLHQETLVKKDYAQLVGLSEGHRYKAFLMNWLNDNILVNCCVMKILERRVNSKV